jgi:hypothetical protein
MRHLEVIALVGAVLVLLAGIPSAAACQAGDSARVPGTLEAGTGAKDSPALLWVREALPRFSSYTMPVYAVGRQMNISKTLSISSASACALAYHTISRAGGQPEQSFEMLSKLSSLDPRSVEVGPLDAGDVHGVVVAPPKAPTVHGGVGVGTGALWTVEIASSPGNIGMTTTSVADGSSRAMPSLYLILDSEAHAREIADSLTVAIAQCLKAPQGQN